MASTAPIVAQLSPTVGVVVTAQITTPGNLIDGKAASFAGNVSSSVVQDACAKIAAGNTTVDVMVTKPSGTITESLSLYNPAGGATAATATGAPGATPVQVATTCANESPSAQGTEFLFKDQDQREIAVVCDGDNATPSQISGTLYGKDTSVCRVYLLSQAAQTVIDQLKAAGVPSKAVAPAPAGSALAAAATAAADGTALGGRRKLLDDYCGGGACSFFPSFCGCTDLNDGTGCFPGNAQVDVVGKGRIAMSELRVSDKVRTINAQGLPTYEEVYFFGHQDTNVLGEMVRIVAKSAAGSASLTLTSRHFVPVGPSMQAAVMKYARDVVIGDILMVSHDSEIITPAVVTHISAITAQGLYNPYTKNGLLVVDGVLASAHSETTFDDWAPAFLVPYLPAIYQMAFKPVFLAYKILGPEFAQSIRPETWKLSGSYASVGILAAGIAGAVIRSKSPKV
ncbi:hypothetical protein WJX73_000963 [Symbiochloris irregularis]|uniref:Hint domain-containing protein n=1 Tax=Symbiochloris irregularis TaxID=706552 RepID=A0AAW1P245_9CHLO